MRRDDLNRSERSQITWAIVLIGSGFLGFEVPRLTDLYKIEYLGVLATPFGLTTCSVLLVIGAILLARIVR